MENNTRRTKKPAYIDIIIEEKTTGHKIECKDSREAAELLGVSTGNMNVYVKRGYYKNYIVSGKPNPELFDKISKFYDIEIENLVTKDKYSNLSVKEATKIMKMPSTGCVVRACEKGCYKNWKITAKQNESYAGKRPEGKDYEKHKNQYDLRKEQAENFSKEVNKPEFKSSPLLLCFEGLQIIENNYEKFGFDDITAFVKWMYDNKFVHEELKKINN